MPLGISWRIKTLDHPLLGEAGKDAIQRADLEPYPTLASVGVGGKPVRVPRALEQHQQYMEVVGGKRQPLARVRPVSHIPLDGESLSKDYSVGYRYCNS